MRPHVLLRCLLVAIALLVAGWLALGLRATRLEAEGREVTETAGERALEEVELRVGVDALHRAREFNVDSEARLIEASLLAAEGRGREAISLAKGVAAKEPKNLEAWVFVYQGSAFASDAGAARRALRRVDELNPQLAERLRARVPLRQ